MPIFLTACVDSREEVKYSYVNAKVLAIESRCSTKWCTGYSYDAGLITPDNEAIIIKKGYCPSNPKDMVGEDVQVLKTQTTSGDGRVVVKWDLCIN